MAKKTDSSQLHAQRVLIVFMNHAHSSPLEVAARNGRRLNDRLGRLIPDVFLRLLLASAFFRFSCHFCA